MRGAGWACTLARAHAPFSRKVFRLGNPGEPADTVGHCLPVLGDIQARLGALTSPGVHDPGPLLHRPGFSADSRWLSLQLGTRERSLASIKKGNVRVKETNTRSGGLQAGGPGQARLLARQLGGPPPAHPHRCRRWRFGSFSSRLIILITPEVKANGGGGGDIFKTSGQMLDRYILLNGNGNASKRMLASVGKGGRGCQGKARPEENLAKDEGEKKPNRVFQIAFFSLVFFCSR